MRPFLLSIPAILMACEEPKYCTEIGCSSGLTLNITDSYGFPAGDTYGTITIDGEQIEYDCRDENESAVFCGEGLIRIQIEGGELLSYSINIDDAEGAQVSEVALSFEEYQPNGEDCPPVCYTAEVEVELARAIDSESE